MESPKAEYSDLYRFGASVGVLIISLALFGPWLILRNDYGLILDASVYNSLETQSKRLFNLKAGVFLFVQENLLVLVITLLIIGLGILIWSICNWYLRRQKFEDNKLRIQPMNEEEKKKEEANRASEQDRDSSSTLNPVTSSDTKHKISEMSKLDMFVTGKLKKCFSNDYAFLTEQKIGSTYYDFILQSLDKNIRDVIIEIKTIQVPKSVEWLNNVLNNLEVIRGFYNITQQKNARALLIVVNLESNLGRSSVEKLKELARSYKDVTVKIIDNDVLTIMDCSEFRRFIQDESLSLT